jgi:hypothetical protein
LKFESIKNFEYKKKKKVKRGSHLDFAESSAGETVFDRADLTEGAILQQIFAACCISLQ